MQKYFRITVISVLIGLLAACATHRIEFADISLDEQISAAIELGTTSCGLDGLEPAVSYRKIFGSPYCRENRYSDLFRDKLRVNTAAALALSGEAFQCNAFVRDVSTKEIDDALTRVMTKNGFLETEVIYILVCRWRTCNGKRYCSGLEPYRSFYRPKDQLSVKMKYGSKDYPHVLSLFIGRADVKHACEDQNSQKYCYPPGALPE